MDVLRRADAPLSARAWAALDEAVAQAARHVLSARRVATFDGPRGFEHLAVPLGTVTPCGSADGGARVCAPNVALLLEIRADFELPWSVVDVFERGGPTLETEAAERAAREVAAAEDRLVLLGQPLGSAGFLTAKGSPRRAIGDWRGPVGIVADLVGAVGTLDAAGIPGPYEALLAPAAYYALVSGADEGYPARKRLSGVVAAVHRSAALAGGGAVFSTRGGDFVLTVGGDLSTGYRAHDSAAIRLFCIETVAAQTLTPEAVCVLSGSNT
jgi:uncharacterized linocin/CFP29 family protein